MQGLVTVFGGSGFVGSAVVRALARAGWRVRVAVREPNLAYLAPLLGEVGQVDQVQANIRDAASVGRALDGAAAAVNLVGVLQEGGRQTFQALMAEGAATVARACAERYIGRLVQVSAIGADARSPSAYARAKAEGERAVLAAVPTAAILRPSIVFGAGDKFFNRFASMATLAPVLPLIGGGGTRFQPVYVSDVAAAAAQALADPRAAGVTYELGGPAIYSFRELMELVLAETGRRRALVPLPWPVAELMGTGGDLAARLGLPAPLTSDQVRLLRRDNVAEPALPGLKDLGVTPTAVEAVIGSYLYRYRREGQFTEVVAPRAGAVD